MTAYVALSEAVAPLPTPKGLDPGIAPWVEILRKYGVETYESCEGGPGHAFPEPTIRFCGQQADGFHALAIARTYGLPVFEIRRFWTVQDGEPVGPNWEMTFRPSTEPRDQRPPMSPGFGREEGEAEQHG